jgi:hypothetical protein
MPYPVKYFNISTAESAKYTQSLRRKTSAISAYSAVNHNFWRGNTGKFKPVRDCHQERRYDRIG